MTFEEALEQVRSLLQRRGKVSLRALRRELDLDDAFLADLKFELIDVLGVARETQEGVLEATAGAAAPPPAAAPLPAPAAASVHPDAAGPPSAELRHLTVMFCDLADSVSLSHALDPEDLRDVVRSYQAEAGRISAHYEGHVAQYLGDGVLVYFGFPRAHEDDAQRAVRAGREILAAVAARNREFEQRLRIRLAVRIGIHTGHVVVGSMGDRQRGEQLAMGVTPNIAARLQSIAEPDTVVISGMTHRLVQHAFEFEDLGLRTLKGVPDPVHAFVVKEGNAAPPRVRGGGTLGALVGRESELALLRGGLERARAGDGRVVLLSGEPGIGKSRLVGELLAEGERSGARVVHLACSPYHADSALFPLLDRWRSDFQLASALPTERLARLEAAFTAAGLPVAEAIPLFAPLLDVVLAGSHAPATAVSEVQKERRRELFLRWIVEGCRTQPTLLVVEDLHWADPSTLDVLTLLMEQTPAQRLLVVMTTRPEFTPPWKRTHHLTQVALSRFNRGEIEKLLLRLTDERRLPPDVVDQIVAKTDGVPLFVEELTKLLLESGALHETERGFELATPLADLAVPATLHDSLMARLDRLADTREIAQFGAALGREFTYAQLRAVAAVGEAPLRRALEKLVDAEIVFQQGIPPASRYTFKHALIQDVAYQSLLKSKRQKIHRRIAEIFERDFDEVARTTPEWLARHWTLAGDAARAVPLWRKAGQLAFARSALTEAIRHLEKALGLLAGAPPSRERDQEELKIQICLGAPYSATMGYGSAEASRAYARAHELSESLGDTTDLFHSLYGMWRTAMLRAEYPTSQIHAVELLRIASATRSTSLRMAAHRAMGACSFYTGDLTVTCDQLDRVHECAAALAQDDAKPVVDLYDVADPRAVANSYQALAWWLRGQPARALEVSARALHLARVLQHPFSQALALSFSTWLHQYRGDVDQTEALSHEVLDLSQKHGFLFWIGWAEVMVGWCVARRGDPARAAAQIEAGLQTWRRRGSELGRSYFFCLLAEVHDQLGDGAALFAALDESRRFTERTSERYWEAERLRLEAEYGLKYGKTTPAEAKALLERARQVAVAQDAKFLAERVAATAAGMRAREA